MQGEEAVKIIIGNVYGPEVLTLLDSLNSLTMMVIKGDTLVHSLKFPAKEIPCYVDRKFTVVRDYSALHDEIRKIVNELIKRLILRCDVKVLDELMIETRRARGLMPAFDTMIEQAYQKEILALQKKIIQQQNELELCATDKGKNTHALNLLDCEYNFRLSKLKSDYEEKLLKMGAEIASLREQLDAVSSNKRPSDAPKKGRPKKQKIIITQVPSMYDNNQGQVTTK